MRRTLRIKGHLGEGKVSEGQMRGMEDVTCRLTFAAARKQEKKKGTLRRKKLNLHPVYAS